MKAAAVSSCAGDIAASPGNCASAMRRARASVQGGVADMGGSRWGSDWLVMPEVASVAWVMASCSRKTWDAPTLGGRLRR